MPDISYDQDAIIETIDEAIVIFRKYMPLSEYDLYAKLLGVRDTLAARRDAERQRYQDKIGNVLAGVFGEMRCLRFAVENPGEVLPESLR